MHLAALDAHPTPITLHALSAAAVRASRNYRFIPMSELPETAAASLRGGPDESPAGLLAPNHGSGLTVKAVSADVAALFSQAERGISLDQAFCADQVSLATLILDGILEIEGPNGYVSGIDAYARVVQEDDEIQAASRSSSISMNALRHVGALPVDSPTQLSGRLYFYGRLPVTPAWRERWPNADAVKRALGIADDGRLPGPAAAVFRPTFSRRYPDQWLIWRRSGTSATRQPVATRYKLYVSPSPSELQPVFARVLATLPASPVEGFKIGANAFGLLRPDKFILYFTTARDLHTYADDLAGRLRGYATQAVPFTAGVAGNPMLSWGVDPIPPASGSPPTFDDSWRTWLCNRMAAMLVSARATAHPATPVEVYVLARLSLLGVDIREWRLRDPEDQPGFGETA